MSSEIESDIEFEVELSALSFFLSYDLRLYNCCKSLGSCDCDRELSSPPLLERGLP